MSGFFKDFVTRLCASENLVDLAGQATARQSSVSRWSHPEDPGRAFVETGRNFAFHTGLEDEPWWEADLGSARRLVYVVIYNRRPPYHQPTVPIRVAISTNGTDWQAVHEGLCSFGSDVGGAPLIVSLAQMEVRYLRISLRGHHHLHLQRVHLLALRQEHAPGTIDFIATRTDGLCQRLLAILNAMILADLYGGRFFFFWEIRSNRYEAFHSVRDAAATFRADFLQNHLVDNPLLVQGAPAYSDRPQSEDGWDAVLKSARQCGAMKAHQAMHLEETFPFLAPRIDPGAYRSAFDRLKLVPALERAKQLAQALELPEKSVCVHVRGGDLFHGKHRFHGNFSDKALSIFELEDLIGRLSAEGQAIYLIGQETEVMTLLMARFPLCRSVSDLHDLHRFDDTEAVFFDVSLMARMARIYASVSAVTQLAGQIGQVDLVPTPPFSGASLAALVRDDRLQSAAYDGLMPCHKAFAHWKLYQTSLADLSPLDAARVVARAVSHAPENNFYRIAHAVTLLALGETEAAELELERAMQSDHGEPENGWTYILTASENRRPIIPRDWMAAFAALARQGSVVGDRIWKAGKTA